MNKKLLKVLSVGVIALIWGVFASPVLADSVNLRGYVTSSGTATAGYYFSYTVNNGASISTPTRSVVVSGTQDVSETVDIPCNSTFQYRLVFWDTADPQNVFQGNVQSSSTSSCSTQNQSSPTITTNSPTSVSATSATFQGAVNSNGGSSTNVWFEWGQTSSFGNTTPQVNVGTVNTTFYSVNNSLNPNTTYYYRAVGQNSGSAVVYGAMQSFTTSSNYNNNNCGYGNYNCNYNYGQTPFVMTYSTVQTGDTFAILQGFVDPNGNTNTTRWFEWGTNSSYFNNTTLKLNQTSSGTFTQTVNGLSSNTTYYYRAVAQNSNGTVYGTVMSFATNSNNLYNSTYNYAGGSQPTAVTTLATSIGQTTARVNGLVFINGGVNTTGWFEWGTTSSLGNTTQSKNIGSAVTLAFSEDLTGLVNGRTYYYRAVVQNQYGTDKGDIMSFTTGGSSNTTSVVVTSPTVTSSKTTYVVSGASGSTKTSAITLSISSNREDVARGDRVIFTINYRNTKTSEDLHDVAIRVVLPGELSFVDASRGYYNEKDRTLTVDLKTLEAGEAGSFTVETRVENSIESGKVVVVSVGMVYTREDNTQEEAIAYVLLSSDTNQSSGALAPLFGSSFLPDTLLGWLLLILIIFCLGVLSRHVVGTYRASNVPRP
ncbi:MAG: hypothetical protein WC724_03140 [Candidatus Paceibacterota bacterium]|jgi:hypothetical protein